MAITPLEQMMSAAMATAISDPSLAALIVLFLFGGFAMVQGPGLDRKVAIMVPGTILAACIQPYLLVLLGIVVGAVLFFPALKRFFQ